MGELVLGAVLGALFQLLISYVVSATQKIYDFSSKLNRLNSTVSSIKLAVGNNNALPWPQHLTQGLTEGEELIEKCSTVNIWNVLRRFWYSHKLTILDDSLSKSFHDAIAAFRFERGRRFPGAETMAILQEMSSEAGEADSNGFEQSLTQDRETESADGAHADLQADESPIRIVIPTS